MSEFLLGIGFTVGALVLIVGAMLLGASRSGEGATLRDRILSSPSLSPLLILHYFLPYGLVVLVLFSDLMSQLPQGVFSIVIGFIMIAINSKLFNDPTVLPNDLCEIPGFKSWSSTMVPQSLLFVSTVVFYLASFVTATVNAPLSQTNVTPTTDNAMAIPTMGSVSAMSPSPSTRIGATWGLALSVVLFQTLGLLMTPGCLSGMKAYGNFSAAVAIAIGALVGGISGWQFAGASFTQPSYGVTTTAGTLPPFVPGLLPTSPSTQAKGPGFVRERFQLGSGLGEMPMASAGGQGGIPVDIAKSSGAVTPGESSDQFVCEAYKNGQLVTSTLVG